MPTQHSPSAPSPSQRKDGIYRNVHSGSRRKPKGIWKWAFTRKRSTWPSWVEDPAFEPPARAAPSELSVTFINHSTFLIQIGGVCILTDPIWARRASPVGFAGPKRVRPPGQKLENLPNVDLLLVSHCHYDHLDLPTLRDAAGRWDPSALTGLGNADLLAKAGITQVRELDWWETAETLGLRITYVPAQHFSARTPFDRNVRLWGGFVIEGGGRVVYFAADSGYSPHFKEIASVFPQIDLALLPIGAYEPRSLMVTQHVNPAEAVRAHTDLRAARSIGMHFGTFSGLTDEDIGAPERDLAAAAAGAGLPAGTFTTMGFGETRLFPV